MTLKAYKKSNVFFYNGHNIYKFYLPNPLKIGVLEGFPLTASFSLRAFYGLRSTSVWWLGSISKNVNLWSIHGLGVKLKWYLKAYFCSEPRSDVPGKSWTEEVTNIISVFLCPRHSQNCFKLHFSMHSVSL